MAYRSTRTAPFTPSDALHGERLEKLDRLARNMDSALRIPGTGIRLGWDSILGLVPGVGDALALAPGAWIVLESHSMGAPRSVLVKQSLNVAIDATIGAIPILGDIFDIGFKSNRRNVALLRKHLEETRVDPTAQDPTRRA